MNPAPRSRLAIACVLGAMALVVLDAGIANVALPTIADALGVAPAQSVWIVTAYQAALVAALLPCADLAGRFGERRLFGGGVALFTLASAACAAAPSLGWLVAARAAQGLGGAAVMALGMAQLRRVVGTERLGRAIGWNALNVALCSAAAPALGAMLLGAAGWRWLFLVNLPLGALIVLSTPALPAHRGDRRPSDKPSYAAIAATVGAALGGLETLATRPILAGALWALAAICALILWRREFRKPVPVVPFDLLRLRPFRLSGAASVCCFAGQAAALVALPFHLHAARGFGLTHTGLVIAAWPLAVALTGPVAGRLADRIDGGRLCAAGCALLAAGLAGFALMPHTASAAAFVLPAAMCGVGFGLFQVPNNRSLFLSAPQHRSAAAGGVQSTARLAGQTIGAAGIAVLLGSLPLEIATKCGFAAGALAVALAGLASLARTGAALPQAASSCASSS
jgi:DHA2 family multidrug resistance protein-like MFS transporter